MTFVDIETRNGMINLDGYSRNKTLKGALKDLAREVAKIDEGEGKCISDYINETAEMVAAGMANEPGAYYIEAEEVPCASRYKFLNGDENDFSEENVEIQYAEGHWYLYIRFCAPEQETEEQEAGQTASAPSTDETATMATDTDSSLTEEEIKYFEDTVARIKYSVNVRVPIEIMNHEQLTGKHKEALGICWAKYDSAGNHVPYRITIDEFFVHECFVAREDPGMKLEPESLEQVIAHEIAHLHYWRHGRKHTELTRHICRLIERGEPHGMGVDATPDTPETGPVLMAAMQPKKQYKEIRKIHASALDQLCIDKGWYVAGSTDDYMHLIFDLAERKENITTADIIAIAEDIMKHSEMEPGCTIENVAFEVARIASVRFEKA